MTTPDISILVPTRDRAHVLGVCLESTIAQRDAGVFEIVVIDDGSKDNTAEVVRAYESVARTAGVELRYFTQQSGGSNAARNHGVREARGDLVVFVDDDIEAPQGWLQAIASGAARHPDVLCFGGPIRLRIEGKPPKTCEYEALATQLDLGPEEQFTDHAWTANMAARRAAFDLIGGFDETIPAGAGDEEQWEIRLLDAGGTIRYLPDAGIWHRRVQADLHFWRMLRGKFRRGYHQVPFYAWAGRPFSRSRETRSFFRNTAHAVRRGCAGGLLEAAQRAGRVWGLSRNRTVIGDQRTSSISR